MDRNAPPSASARRRRRVVLVALAVVGVAIVAFGPVGMALRILSVPLHQPKWQVWVLTWNGVALSTVIALPVAALAVWALAHRRSAAGVGSPWRRALSEVGMVYGTVPWVWLTLQPGARPGTAPGVVLLVPLRDLLTMDPVQIVGNVLVFAALGFFAPLRFASLASLPRILALAAGCSVLIETAQYVLRLDRVSSVDDVLLNAAGAGLAALVSRPWWGATAEAWPDRPTPARSAER